MNDIFAAPTVEELTERRQTKALNCDHSWHICEDVPDGQLYCYSCKISKPAIEIQAKCKHKWDYHSSTHSINCYDCKAEIKISPAMLLNCTHPILNTGIKLMSDGSGKPSLECEICNVKLVPNTQDVMFEYLRKKGDYGFILSTHRARAKEASEGKSST